MSPELVVAFFVSGAAALMLEVVWSRQLHLLFGGSAVATSAVLSAYMGGLAAGSLWLAPVVRRRMHPALAYGVLELGVAAYALIAPFLIAQAGVLQAHLAEGGSEGLGAFVRFVLAAVVLAFPTTLMGATLPCLADLAGEGSDDGAGSVGILYAGNTLGAVAGTVGATFIAFPSLGVWHTNVLAAALDALVAAGALGWWLHARKPLPIADVSTERGLPPNVRKGALLAYGLSGAVAMALEVVWTRALSMVVGSSIHAFSLMLGAFLTGLAVGARLASSVDASRRRAWPLLASILAVTGMFAFAGTWLIDGLPQVMFVAAKYPDMSVTFMRTAMLFCAAAVMFPAAVGFGAVLPVALSAALPGGDRTNVGDLVGRAYAINTTGAIIGALLGGFVLGPGIGVDRAAQALSALLVGIAALMVAREQRRRAVAMVMVAASMAVWQGFDVARWSAGAFRVYLARQVWEELPEGNVIFRKDGLSTTITVEEYNGRVSLKVNGKVDASSDGDMPTQVLSGLLPIMFHPDPRRGAIIGFGSGVTSDAALAYGPLERLEMVELEPAVVEAGRFFATVNHRPWDDPRYVGIFDDGRHHLARPGPPLDFIISEPSNPWITGASNLFTEEFWTLARSRLAPGGVFLQWVQLYELSTERIQSLMGTFSSVFPHALVFAANPDSNDTLVIGSTQPLVLDEQLLRKRWADPAIRRQLIRAEVTSPLDLLALLLMDGDDLRRFVAGYRRNTDDNMYVELNAPRDLIAFASREPELPFMKDLKGRREALIERNTRFVDDWEPGQLTLALAESMLQEGLMEDARAFAVQLIGMGPELEARKDRVLEAIDVITGDDEVAVADESVARLGDARYLRAVQAMVEGDDRKALLLFESFPGLETESHAFRMLYAYLLYRDDLRWRARDMIEPLINDARYRREHPQVLYYGSRISWLDDNNQRAAKLALEYVDIRNAQRLELLRGFGTPQP